MTTRCIILLCNVIFAVGTPTQCIALKGRLPHQTRTPPNFHTVIAFFGFLVNFADGVADIYQLILIATLGAGWYLIESK